MTTTVTDRGYKKLREQLEKLKGTGASAHAQLKVGILAAAGAHEDESLGPKLTVAQVAAYHEFGSPGRNIPERSFIRSTLEEKKSEFSETIAKMLGEIADGKRAPKSALGVIGMTVATAIKHKIVAGDFAPLAPETIKRKGSSKPLIDTGQLLNSIDYQIDMGE